MCSRVCISFSCRLSGVSLLDFGLEKASFCPLFWNLVRGILTRHCQVCIRYASKLSDIDQTVIFFSTDPPHWMNSSSSPPPPPRERQVAARVSSLRCIRVLSRAACIVLYFFSQGTHCNACFYQCSLILISIQLTFHLFLILRTYRDRVSSQNQRQNQD